MTDENDAKRLIDSFLSVQKRTKVLEDMINESTDLDTQGGEALATLCALAGAAKLREYVAEFYGVPVRAVTDVVSELKEV